MAKASPTVALVARLMVGHANGLTSAGRLAPLRLAAKVEGRAFGASPVSST